MEPWHPALQDAFDIFTGKSKGVSSYEKWEKEGLKDEEHPLLPYHCTEESEVKIFLPAEEKGQAALPGQRSGQALMKPGRETVMKGRLLGGCMDCLVNLTGTKFDKVKEFNEKYKEEGIIWFLESCDLNVFSIRRAMWQEMMGLDQYQAVLYTAAKHGVPVIMDADLGHLPPMMPMITGSLAEISAEDGKVKIRTEYK